MDAVSQQTDRSLSIVLKGAKRLRLYLAVDGFGLPIPFSGTVTNKSSTRPGMFRGKVNETSESNDRRATLNVSSCCPMQDGRRFMRTPLCYEASRLCILSSGQGESGGVDEAGVEGDGVLGIETETMDENVEWMHCQIVLG